MLIAGCQNTVIPNSVTIISGLAFQGCTGLTSITIPNSVTEIRDNAFEDSGLTSITMPNVITIYGDAFKNCLNLTSVFIPESIRGIGDNAFTGCRNLTDVFCFAQSLYASKYAFTSTYIGYATLHVPATSLDFYRTTEPWSRFGSIVALPDYRIHDGTASFNITTKESGKGVEFNHEFTGNWESLYLPFAIDYDAIKADFDLAEIDGVIQHDDNNDGIVDITVLSIIGFREQLTEPNTPYLIRAKQPGEQMLMFNNVTVYPTTVQSLESSSTSVRYEFTGSYNALNSSSLTNRYIVQDGELVKGAYYLPPCRWYMTPTAKRGALNLPNRIRIMPVEDVITGVSPLGETEEESAIYNLAGQRLNKMQKGINIVGGKKIIRK